MSSPISVGDMAVFLVAVAVAAAVVAVVAEHVAACLSQVCAFLQHFLKYHP